MQNGLEAAPVWIPVSKTPTDLYIEEVRVSRHLSCSQHSPKPSFYVFNFIKFINKLRQERPHILIYA